MSEQQLREMFAHAFKHAERVFAKDGVVMPMYHAVTADGINFVMEPPHRDKDVSVAMVRALFEIRNVVRYLFVDEAWTLDKVINGDELKFVHREGVRAHPERVEIVMVIGEDHECGQIAGQRRIIRPRKGKAYLGPIIMMEDLPNAKGGKLQSEGRMVGMLPVKGMKQ